MGKAGQHPQNLKVEIRGLKHLGILGCRGVLRTDQPLENRVETGLDTLAQPIAVRTRELLESPEIPLNQYPVSQVPRRPEPRALSPRGVPGIDRHTGIRRAAQAEACGSGMVAIVARFKKRYLFVRPIDDQ